MMTTLLLTMNEGWKGNVKNWGTASAIGLKRHSHGYAT